MAVRVRPISLWRTEVDNQPGALARTLEPLTASNLQVVMGYRLPGNTGRAAIEVAPVAGARATTAAQTAGLSESGIAALVVEGEDRPGLGHAIARALADAGINMEFLMAQVAGGRHSTVIGFENSNDAERAVPLIKKAAAPLRGGSRKTAGRAAGTRRGATRKSGGRKTAARKRAR
jgi:hypothetical protein